MTNFAHFTDKELFELCREYGTKALTWRKKFIGLLPEVNRRRLYETKGFSSIFEFAAKLCGISEEQVRLALNLEKRFEDKPSLKALLTNGEESINKLARVASIATLENEKELAARIKFLPNRAVETLVRDEKQSLHVHSNSQQNLEDATAQFKANELELSPEVTEKLLALQQKGIDINKLILELLNKREEEIAATKETLAGTINLTTSRYIPVQIKRILKEEYGEKCSIATCQKPAKIIHHTQRFSLSQNHDPRFLAPLCREHHAIAHSIDFQYHRMRPA